MWGRIKEKLKHQTLALAGFLSRYCAEERASSRVLTIVNVRCESWRRAISRLDFVNSSGTLTSYNVAAAKQTEKTKIRSIWILC
jgi:hypothetical protein